MITVYDTEVSRAFESALAAFRCGDANPMRQYLALPLKQECQDCGRECITTPWDNRELLCGDCFMDRHDTINAYFGGDSDA